MFMKRTAVLTLLVLAAVVIWASVAYVQAREEIKLTTIIPDQTTALFKKGAIGATYLTTFVPNPDSIPDSALFVEGNVGIGTMTPATSLDIFSTHATPMIIKSTNAASMLLFKGDMPETSGPQGYYIGSSKAANKFHILGSSGIGNERLTIDSIGNVGIGTTNPENRLHVSLGNVENVRFESGTPANGYQLRIDNNNSTGSQRSAIGFRSNNVNRWVIGNDISCNGTNDFFICSGDAINRIYISPLGNVGIGLGVGAGGAVLPIHLIQLGGGAYCDGTTDWIAGSDKAYKKDIDYNFKYGLKEVEQLKPVYYVHKEDKENKKQIGFIAQDVRKVVPELVSGEEGALGLSYGQLAAVLVKAVQEQQAQIESLNKKISDLEKRK